MPIKFTPPPSRDETVESFLVPRAPSSPNLRGRYREIRWAEDAILFFAEVHAEVEFRPGGRPGETNVGVRYTQSHGGLSARRGLAGHANYCDGRSIPRALVILARSLQREIIEESVVHLSPAVGANWTGGCGKHVSEIPASERMTDDALRVTCGLGKVLESAGAKFSALDFQQEVDRIRSLLEGERSRLMMVSAGGGACLAPPVLKVTEPRACAPCEDCKGSRTYQPLFGPPEPCRSCCAS
jgi:hypothetical protein